MICFSKQMFYSLASLTAFVVTFVFGLDVFLSARKDRARGRGNYLFLLGMALFYFVTDFLWGIFDGLENKIYATADTVAYFLAMSGTVLAWTLYVAHSFKKHRVFNRIMIVSGSLMFLAAVTLLVINGFTPIMFTYESGSYQAGKARYVFLGTQIVMFAITTIYSALLSMRTESKSHRLREIAIAFFGIIMSAAIVVQWMFPLYPIYAIGCLIGLVEIRTFVISSERRELVESVAESRGRENQSLKELATARDLAYHDPLTGAKNKYAYVELEDKIDSAIREKTVSEFALFVMDLNDLKAINDTYGHEAGDRYIKDSYDLIKSFFPDSEVYRFGGDEFVVLVTGKAYEDRYRIAEAFNAEVDGNVGQELTKPIVALGLSEYEPATDNTFRSVFLRADDRMYARKHRLKEAAGEDATARHSVIGGDNIRQTTYDLFYQNNKKGLLFALESSNSDEIIDVDIKTMTFRSVFHTEGKYYLPPVERSFPELTAFVAERVVHPDDRELYTRTMQLDGFIDRLRNARIPGFDFAHFRFRLQDGGYRYVEQAVITGEEYGVEKDHFRLYILDINNIKLREYGQRTTGRDSINREYDVLTGLLSTKAFLLRAEQLIREDTKGNLCLFLLDIENFKFFDELYGREKGDELLIRIAKKTDEFTASCDGIGGYFGNDDFVVVCPFDTDAIHQYYRDVRAIIASFGMSAGFAPAIGIAQISDDIQAVDAYDRASIACAKAKEDLGFRVLLFSSDMQHSEEANYRVLSEFMKAMQDGEITFYLQPQVRIATKSIVGAEALARWIKPDGTVVSPGVFVPALEKFGFISDLDQYLWDKVCDWLKGWIDSGHKAVPVSINVSRADIYGINVCDYLVKLTNKYGLPHKYIKVEVTESFYVDNPELVNSVAKDLQKNGFLVMMDDFGAGSSSLSMLSNIPVDVIKLDASFLHLDDKGIGKGMHILESVINLTKSMGTPIVVEGIETQEQSDYLEGLGCRYAQGYHFYRPMPVADFERILLDKKKIDSRGFILKANEQFRLREFLDENVYSDSMLNNIIGSVAIYLLRDGCHVDIIRYNEQFYESVGVPDFDQRLISIESIMPENDGQILINTLKEAMKNPLLGAESYMRFDQSDGRCAFYRIHFYYIGHQNDGERFYGSATNVTDLADLRAVSSLVAKGNSSGLIFMRSLFGKWEFKAYSNNLSNLFAITPDQLSEELNDGSFAKRLHHPRQWKVLLSRATKAMTEKRNFSTDITVATPDKKEIVVSLEFTYIKDEAYNFAFALKALPRKR